MTLTDSLFHLSGSEALPAVSQHWGQRGCRDGHRDGECVQLNTSVRVLNDEVLSKYVFVFQVGQAKDGSLTNQLIDYLMGESDGMPKVINTLTHWSLLSFQSQMWMWLSQQYHFVVINSLLQFLNTILSFSSLYLPFISILICAQFSTYILKKTIFYI